MAVLIAVLVGAALGRAAPQAATPSGPQLLARSDALKAEALERGDNRLLKRAGVLADQAQGRTFTVDGRPAAVSGASARGAVSPVEQPNLSIRRDRPWRYRLAFRGREPAFVYARTTRRSPIELEVSDADGRLVCRSQAISGRAVCGWRPDRTAVFHIRVRLTSAATDRLAVFVN